MRSNMTCALKVDTRCKGWYSTTTKILKKIGGLSYELDAKEGMIYISGSVDPQNILNKVAKYGKNNIELCWIKTGEQYSFVNANVMDQYGPPPMPVSPYSYVEAQPPYQRRFYPECPPPLPYYNQYHNYDPMLLPPPSHGYPPQLPYYY